MYCTLRGGFNPFGPERHGRDIFSLQFPRDVGKRADRVDIYVSEERRFSGSSFGKDSKCCQGCSSGNSICGLGC